MKIITADSGTWVELLSVPAQYSGASVSIAFVNVTTVTLEVSVNATGGGGNAYLLNKYQLAPNEFKSLTGLVCSTGDKLNINITGNPISVRSWKRGRELPCKYRT